MRRHGDIRLLSQEDISEAGVTDQELIGAVEEAFRLKGRGEYEMPPKFGVTPFPDCLIRAMPAHVKGKVDAAGVKWIHGYVTNPARGLPYISGVLVLSDVRLGVPSAVMDCAIVTAMRTGAGVGVVARNMARRGASAVAIIGTGVQARRAVACLCQVLPEFTCVRAHDISKKAMAKFKEEILSKHPAVNVVCCTSTKEAVMGADIVISATPIVERPAPDIDIVDLSPGVLAIALNYDSSFTREAMHGCDVFITDDVSQLLDMKKHGPYFAGVPPAERIIDLGDVICGKVTARQNQSERVFVMKMGIAIEDIVAGKLVLDRAISKGIGKSFNLISKL